MIDRKEFGHKKLACEYTLTKEQLHELIQAKLERAERMSMQLKVEERKQIYT